MRIIRAAKELVPEGRKVAVAIGFFDGVHLGHQQIIRQTVTDARQCDGVALIVTFDCHPHTVVAPLRRPPLIYSLTQRLRTLGFLQADDLLLIHFDRAFSQQTGEDFIRRLVCDLGPVRSLCVGANFVFGHKRGGNVELLRRLGLELGFTVHGLAAVSLDGRRVSSTRIREAIAAGNLDQASQMLGRAYCLAGTVVVGDQVGRQLGFPTANIDVEGLALPPRGVYAVKARVGQSWHRAVLNIGVRPTIGWPEPRLRVEAHLMDFGGDLYGQEMEVAFVARLRDEAAFASVGDLRKQIAQDILDAQLRF